jgi:hypothetical protein
VKVFPFCVCLFLFSTAVAQQRGETQPKGLIYGIVIGQDGKPATGITLVACPDGALSTMLPSTRSNDAGEFRFENLPWWGKYRVYPEDDDRGYSLFSSGPGRDEPSKVELTPQHQKAQMKVYLPPQAGFLHIHLSSRRTGNLIPGMAVSVRSMEHPDSLLFTISCYSNHVVLMPPDTDILLHVTSEGFHEWEESIGKGKPLRLASGADLTLNIQLEPAE